MVERGAYEQVRHEPESLAPNRALVLRNDVASGAFMADFRSLPAGQRGDVFRTLTALVRALRTEDGPFWAPGSAEGQLRARRLDGVLRLDSIDEAALAPAARRLLRGYQANIANHGPTALAHLCLSSKSFKTLTEVDITTLDRAYISLSDPDVAHVVWNHGRRHGSIGFELKAKLQDLESERSATPHRDV